MPLALGVKDFQWRLNFKGSSRASAEPRGSQVGQRWGPCTCGQWVVCFSFTMTKIQIVNMIYIYIHDGTVMPHKKLTILSFKRARFGFSLCTSFSLCFQQLPSITSWKISLLLFFAAEVWVHSLSNHYIRSSLWKSQLWFFSTFGVQFETHYESGIVFHRFIPIGKILKSVLNEHVTPFTCYWSLALVVHGKEECIAWQTWNYLNNWWMKSQRHEFFFLFISGMGPVASRWVIISFFSFLSRAIFLISLFMLKISFFENSIIK